MAWRDNAGGPILILVMLVEDLGQKALMGTSKADLDTGGRQSSSHFCYPHAQSQILPPFCHCPELDHCAVYFSKFLWKMYIFVRN